MPTHFLGSISLAFLCLFANCGGSAEMPSDGDQTPEGALITVRSTSYPLSLLVFRNAADSEWKSAEAIDPLGFQFSVQGPYLVAVVCEESAVLVFQFARTLEDERDLTIRCEHADGPHRVSGQVAQNTVLHGSSFSTIVSAGGSFELMMRDGTFDVIANTEIIAGTPSRVAIRRGIRVAGDTVLTPIDLAAEGADVVPTAFTLTNGATPAPRQVRIGFLSSRGGGSLQTFSNNSGPDAVPVIPNSILQHDDRQTVTAFVGGGMSIRRTFREGDSTAFTVPDDRMGPATFTQSPVPRAAWSTLPEHDLIRSSISPSSAILFYEMVMTRSFEVATAALEIGLDPLIPLRPEWIINLTEPYAHSLSAERHVGNDVQIWDQAIPVNGPFAP